MKDEAEHTTLTSASQSLTEFIEREFPKRLHSPAGSLRHPYLDPAGEHYVDSLWDWDAHFCAAGLRPWAAQVAEHVQGSLLNFLDFQGKDGHIPYALNPDSEYRNERDPEQPWNSAKPILAQFALLALEYGRAASHNLLDESALYGPLLRHMDHWEETQRAPSGLLTFRSHRGSGTDNHPAVFARPFNSSADVFLNCLAIREYDAVESLARTAGDHGAAKRCAERARTLRRTVRERMWDPIDGMFYNIDEARQDVGEINQTPDWPVPLKFRMWTGFLPLWAEAAAPRQAKRLVEEHLINAEEFLSPNGIRSMAKNEPAHTLFRGGNPSNWQGPVWTVSNAMIVRGLLRYGFRSEAEQIADSLLGMLARDLRTTGCLHEYYHPETGEGLTHPGFFDWNTLAAVLEGDVHRAVQSV